MYEQLANYLPETYIALFSVSITMAGLIAVFVVFRYQIIDNYVDNWKSVLRKLLKKNIEKEKDGTTLLRIQNIGKDKNIIQDDIQYFKQLNEKSVELVNDILRVRNDRDNIRKYGFRIIVTWASLALLYLFLSLCCSRCNHWITCIDTIIVIGLFVAAIVFTLIFIYKSLNPSKK